MALVFLVGATVGFAQTKPDASVARSRAKHLRRGFDLSEWFTQEDLAPIKAMGFDHVRLSVNPKPMWRHNEADEIPAEYLGD
jgi:endoglucanase